MACTVASVVRPRGGSDLVAIQQNSTEDDMDDVLACATDTTNEFDDGASSVDMDFTPVCHIDTDYSPKCMQVICQSSASTSLGRSSRLNTLDSDWLDGSDVGHEDDMVHTATWDGFEDDVIALGSPMWPVPVFAMPFLAQLGAGHVPQAAPMYSTLATPCGLEFVQPEAGHGPSFTAALPVATGTKCTAEKKVAGQKTTVMLRNIPNNYNRDKMLELIDAKGFSEQYDFFYLPCDGRSHKACGYAFLNFTSHASAVRAIDVFNGFSAWGGNSCKVCEVTWSETHQGQKANLASFNKQRNRRRVPEECKPFVVKNGWRVVLP